MTKSVAITLFWAALLVLAGAHAAGTGKIKVSVKDQQGRVMNGSAKAVKSAEAKTCTTAAGTCTLGNLSEGTWSVELFSPSGAKIGGPSKAVVSDGKTVDLYFTVKTAATTKSLMEKKTPAKDGKTRKFVGAQKAKPKSQTEGRDLAVGKTKRATGAIRDAGGHALNGKIIVKRGNAVIGTAATAAGTYRLYDLEPGEYVFAFATASGEKASQKVTIAKDKLATVNFQIGQSSK